MHRVAELVFDVLRSTVYKILVQTLDVCFLMQLP